MFDENQIVHTKWHSSNKELYESKGYIFTKIGDNIDVEARYLKHSSTVRVNVLCDYCETLYETSYAKYIDGRKKSDKDCCFNCRQKKSNEIKSKKYNSKIIDQINKICLENEYMLITDISENINSHTHIRYICPKHGEQNSMVDNFLRGHLCLECGYILTGNKLRNNANKLSNKISEIDGNTLLNPNDYKNSNTTNLKIKCSCGNIFTTSYSAYINGANRCSKCSHSESSGEKIIREFLDDNMIEYIKEKRFDNCKDIYTLPFDFYLPNYNTIIEFDGRHHYEPIYGEDRYFKTVQHDKIKNIYCQENDIFIIRIPYWEGHNIQSIIKEKLNL